MQWTEDLLCNVYEKLLRVDDLIEEQVKEVDSNRSIEIAILLDSVVAKLDLLIVEIESE